jgi:NDP-mannose synthase
MKAVILAGGKGTRLAPYTMVLPKPLVPVGGIPILETVLRQLRHQGFREVVLAVGYLSPLIRAYFDNNPITDKLWLRYHQEQQPLGTAGAIGSIEGLDEPFIAMNGDLLTTVNYADMLRFHASREAALTIAVTERQLQVEVGVLTTDDEDRITRYDEKPVHRFAASMGIYAMSPKVRSFVQPGIAQDIPDLVRNLLASGERILAYRPDAFWLDMGNRADYERASEAFERNRTLFLPDGC